MRESVIGIGSKNRKMVIEIQKIVGAKVDGDYGPQTQRLVAIWQANEGLAADGIVGPKTMEAMGILDTDQESGEFGPQFRTPNGLIIERHYL